MIKMLWKSFGNVEAYAEALKTWRVKFLLYPLLVLCVSALLIASVNIYYFHNFVNNDLPYFAKQITEFTLTKDGISPALEKPYYIKSKDSQNVAAISSDFVDSNEMASMFVAFEKDRFTLHILGDENYRFYADFFEQLKILKDVGLNFDTDKIVINEENVLTFFNYAKKFSFIIFPIVSFWISLFIFILFVLSLSIPAFIMSLRPLPNLGYFGALKISILASTPAMILQSMELALGYNSLGGIFYAILSFIILWKVINRIAINRLM